MPTYVITYDNNDRGEDLRKHFKKEEDNGRAWKLSETAYVISSELAGADLLKQFVEEFEFDFKKKEKGGKGHALAIVAAFHPPGYARVFWGSGDKPRIDPPVVVDPQNLRDLSAKQLKTSR